MKKKLPAIQFYFGDWKKDAELSMCSLATRGFWFEVLGAMFERDRSGVITGTAEQIARVARCTAQEAQTAISELHHTKAANVSECNGVYTLVNRRMNAEFKARTTSAERVRRHRQNKDVTKCNANVTMCNANVTDDVTEIEASVTSPVNAATNIDMQFGADMKRECNAGCNEKVTPPSSSSPLGEDKSSPAAPSIRTDAGVNFSPPKKPPKKPVATPVNHSDHQRLMAWCAAKTGPIPDGAAQGKAVKWLLEHYAADDCEACWTWLANQSWRQTRISWLTVKSEIGAWKATQTNSNSNGATTEEQAALKAIRAWKETHSFAN